MSKFCYSFFHQLNQSTLTAQRLPSNSCLKKRTFDVTRGLCVCSFCGEQIYPSTLNANITSGQDGGERVKVRVSSASCVCVVCGVLKHPTQEPLFWYKSPTSRVRLFFSGRRISFFSIIHSTHLLCQFARCAIPCYIAHIRVRGELHLSECNCRQLKRFQ